MEKKIYLYDSHGFEFYACSFEGLDAVGRPRLTIMSPGRSVENFWDYLQINDEDPGNYFLLCEEGKPADSKFVIEMLGQILLNTLHPYERMSERLDEMRKYGISNDRELQTVIARIYDYDNVESKSTKYRLILYVGNHRYVTESHDFDKLSDVIVTLSGFFFFIENSVKIPVKKILEVSESLKKQVSRHSSNMFEEIKTI